MAAGARRHGPWHRGGGSVSKECASYHATEARRIESELSRLSPTFSKDGIVRYVLNQRIVQERRRAEGQEACEHDSVVGAA